MTIPYRTARLAAVAAFVPLVLAACASVTEQSLQQQGVKPLSAAEMKDYFSRTRTADFTTATNATGRIQYAADGTVKADTRSRSFAGRWRLDGDRLCTTYPDLRDGREGCARVYRTGPKQITGFWPEGPTVANELD
jgi:hypothetical protein